MLDIKGIDKAKILAELYNAAKPSNTDGTNAEAKNMTVDEAAKLLKKQKYFDTINGRIIQVDLRSDILDTYSYDRSNGEGEGYKVWKKLRN